MTKVKIEVICEYCGCKFKKLPSRIREGKHVFCCLDHANKQLHKPNKIKVKCEVCGIEIEKIPFNANNFKHHFCCQAHYLQWQNHQNIVPRLASIIQKQLVRRYLIIMLTFLVIKTHQNDST